MQCQLRILAALMLLYGLSLVSAICSLPHKNIAPKCGWFCEDVRNLCCFNIALSYLSTAGSESAHNDFNGRGMPAALLGKSIGLGLLSRKSIDSTYRRDPHACKNMLQFGRGKQTITSATFTCNCHSKSGCCRCQLPGLVCTLTQ